MSRTAMSAGGCLLRSTFKPRVCLVRGFLIYAILAVAFGVVPLPAQAQSAAFLLGNPEITPGLQTQGYVITHSVSQTATSTSIYIQCDASPQRFSRRRFRNRKDLFRTCATSPHLSSSRYGFGDLYR